jgi:hypothetical protein
MIEIARVYRNGIRKTEPENEHHQRSNKTQMGKRIKRQPALIFRGRITAAVGDVSVGKLVKTERKEDNHDKKPELYE